MQGVCGCFKSCHFFFVWEREGGKCSEIKFRKDLDEATATFADYTIGQSSSYSHFCRLCDGAIKQLQPFLQIIRWDNQVVTKCNHYFYVTFVLFLAAVV